MELWERSAIGLAQSIASGEVSSREVVDAHIARIERVNPQINAVIFERFEEARHEAGEVDARRSAGEPLGPLGGVPISIKECLDVARTPSTYGLASWTGNVAATDGVHVRRLRDAGAIVIGKTNLSQLMIYVEADNPVHGRTNNPWNLARSCGGSSGGEGAIVAAGGTPLGFGADIGGSIRVPAHFCGVVGLKPTTGRLPDTTRLPIFEGQRAITSEEGPFARDVADVALALEIANGGRDPATLPPRPLGDARAVDVRSLRIGFYESIGSFAPAPAVARAVREAAAMLAGAGARVVPFQPPNVDRVRDVFFGIFSADGGRGAIDALGSDKRDPRVADLLFAVSRPRYQLALLQRALRLGGQNGLADIVRNYGRTDTHHYWKLVEELRAYQTAFAVALDSADGGPLDLIVCPPFSLPALPHGKARDVVLAGSYTLLYNALGYPTGIVPFTRVRADEQVGRKPSRDRMEQAAYETETASAGLPIGVQVVAHPWREHEALAAMFVLEAAARERADFPRTPVIPKS